MNFEIANFENDIIQESYHQPVLVDFWAAWCGPCRVLGPVLEKLADQAKGIWKLAKIDVDRNQEIASQFGIQGIPAVKLFNQGQVIGEFVGALPESEIQKWLGTILPSEGRRILSEAAAAADEGRRNDAISKLENILENEDIPEARSLLARLIVLEQTERAVKLIDGLDESTPGVEGVREMVTILALDPEQLPDGDGKSTMVAALQSIRESKWQEALESLVETIRRDKSYLDEAARKACIGLFRFLGDEHPLTLEFRPRFSMALF